MRIGGNGPSPVGGSGTSTSIGVPSKLVGREARSVVGQKRTPFISEQAWPKGVGSACAAATGTRRPAVAASAARQGRRGISITVVRRERGASQITHACDPL